MIETKGNEKFLTNKKMLYIPFDKIWGCIRVIIKVSGTGFNTKGK